MSMDLTGITNKNEYYTNHYFSTLFEEGVGEAISAWNTVAKGSEIKTPWSFLRRCAPAYYAAHDRFVRSSLNMQTLNNIRELADSYLASLGYPAAEPQTVEIEEGLSVPVYLEMRKNNGAPLLWVVLMASFDDDMGVMESYTFDSVQVDEDAIGNVQKGFLGEIAGEELATKILFAQTEPPRFLILIGMNQIALIDRNKWNEKRYMQFELEEIFSRLENSTLQAMSVLLHKDSLCPEDGKVLLDELDEQSQRNASGVSQDLKYALRESIELLGNEVLYDMKTRLGRDLEADPVDAGQLTLECLRYMYRMLFVLFIEARPELGYAPIKAQAYKSGYSLESLRDIADDIRDDIDEVGDGYYLHETLAKLYDLIYNGYPKTEEELQKAISTGSLHNMFLVAPLKAHIFDPEFTKMLTASKLRNSCMLRIIELMSLTKASGRRNSRRGRISYANLGINQMGAVYEALLSYRGFIAEHDLYEVKRAGDSFNELDVGYFVSESELDQYTEDERVRYESGEKRGKLRMYKKGSFIYRLAGREREKSASYYTPEVLTKCLVKYALKELLEGKTADEILKLTVCEPAMGSAAFLNEAINQLAEAYITRKEQETGITIGYEDRFNEIQKVKMYIADRNVYGIDLNPVAVELAEVSLWLNTIHEGGFVPWFGTQLVNGNSLIGARRQAYRVENLTSSSRGLRWYENAPERVPLGTQRADKSYKQNRKQVWHFLLGDPGMCNYTDKVIKSLEPDNIKKMSKWNKEFTKPYGSNDIGTLLELSSAVDQLWDAQVKLRKEVELRTQDALSVFGYSDDVQDSKTTIRQKDKILSELYKSEHIKNAGPYARLKFAMDYWCALWFWPIDKADLLPSRDEFFFDMSLILKGTVNIVSATNYKGQLTGQVGIFETELQQMANKIQSQYEGLGEVDIPALRSQNERLNLAYEIAEQNHFMHWELEFADLFVERGGFDLIIGNPPWLPIKWEERGILSEIEPLIAVKGWDATTISQSRSSVLLENKAKEQYLTDYEITGGQQNFLGATSNYPDLKGAINLYKNFLPQAWMFSCECGVCAFIHPEGVFDDPKGGALREKLYPRLRKHFMFANERKLFPEVHHHTSFSLNVYGGPQKNIAFDSINNLYDARTIESCYEGDKNKPIPKTRDEMGNWETQGHPDRIIRITNKELRTFSAIFGDGENWYTTSLVSVHAKALMDVLNLFAKQEETNSSLHEDVYTTGMWHETNAQKERIIEPYIGFPENNIVIYSGAHIGLANPCYQTTRSNYRVNSDYDVVDLTQIPANYQIREKYRPCGSIDEYLGLIPTTPWGKKVTQEYRLINREMVGCTSERTLCVAIAPPGLSFVNTVFGVSYSNLNTLVKMAGYESSIPFDFLVRSIGKDHVNYSTTMLLPIITSKVDKAIMQRVLMLNCITERHAKLWEMMWGQSFTNESWTKVDNRLSPDRFSVLSKTWKPEFAVRTDYERRQMLIEIDVLASMGLGMSLEQLKTVYELQFSVLQDYESDTWFDTNGRIVFTKNKGLKGVGFSRSEWEGGIKGATANQKFYRTFIDDTLPGGPIERTIEYVAPFERCNREEDYETAWKFFEEKYRA